MRNLVISTLFISTFLTACGNPGGVSDETYSAYKKLGAPKILYACDKGLYTLPYDPKIMAECRKIEGFEKEVECINRARRESKRMPAEVSYVAGIGAGVTYNQLLTETEAECKGKFTILDSKE